MAMNIVKIFGLMIQSDLDTLKEFTDETLGLIESHKAKLIQRVQSEVENQPPHLHDEIFEGYEDQHWTLDTAYPRLLNNSIFVATYSFTESSLSRICRKLEKTAAKPITLTNLKGENGLDKFKLYLEKVQGIAYKAGLAEWAHIDNFRKARNFIVHNDAFVDDSGNGNAVKNFAATNGTYLEIDDLDRITIKKEGNNELMRCARVVLLDVVANIS